MISKDDLLQFTYTPDLTEGGIAYACRSLAYTYNRMGGTSSDRLRRIVAGVAVELAFRRFLSERVIPFDVFGATPFTDPDHYDVSLGGHRCDIKSFFLSRRRQIAQLHCDLTPLLQASALIPLDQFIAEGHQSEDLYLFAFLMGTIAASSDGINQAITRGQPIYLIHPMPEQWARPRLWQPLKDLAIKSESKLSINVEIGGQDIERNFVTKSLELPPRTKILINQPFYTIAYIHAGCRTGARIGLHSPTKGEPYLIKPYEWSNIWIYGLCIVLSGYMSHEEFRRKAHILPVGSNTFQYDRTRTKNLALPVRELRPINDLLDKIRKFKETR